MHPRLPLLKSRHALPILALGALSLAYWGKVLFTDQVLLPGAMLGGFAPFGGNPTAPWNILQWDALGQYYPWRLFAAQQLQQGVLPLWNPHQFAGAPFIANGQSAVFYPLNLPFWTLNVAYAFGVCAALHTLLAAVSTYFLAQRWQLSRAAALLAAIAFGFCGYLSAWAMLPTLANTASWLPLLILLLEDAARAENPKSEIRNPKLALALCCALLAGHAQVFIYLLFGLTLRALLLPQKARVFGSLLFSLVLCAALGALQVLPTLELARIGHRAAEGGPTLEAWHKIMQRALQPLEFPSLLVADWPMLSFSESFGYVGVGAVLLALTGVLIGWRKGSHANAQSTSPLCFSILLVLFGLLYATATPLAKFFYFFVPGLSQMGGVVRALVLWSFGIALLAAWGLDALRQRWRSEIIPVIALVIVTAELFAAGWNLHPIAPRRTIYPRTELTDWLQRHTRDRSRVLFVTPRGGWLPAELFQNGRSHPPGVLPPNGAMIYGLYDVNGYDSLAPLSYRQFVIEGEGADVSPPLNGNMILLENPNTPPLDMLNVRYVVSTQPQQDRGLREVLRADGCIVYERLAVDAARGFGLEADGRNFSPGWRNGKYQPESFRFGAFVSLCALAFVATFWTAARPNKNAT
ncbi:MAG TPA: hypothetical protein VNA16_11280 [Abditibacteriaceae bacterium]|nr:hypothetical protein [Abditibacteriaceae bacterium]